MDPLKQDVLQAYEELGGINYLMREPALLKRILVRLVKQQAPQPEVIIDLARDMPWLNFTSRLSYKDYTVQEEQSTEVIELSPSPTKANSPPLIGWREPESDGLAKTIRGTWKKDLA
jgi:hypothetical protein